MSENSSKGALHLLDLPNEMLQEIMSYLTYDEIAKCRAVCKKFDENNRQMLNRGYQLIISQLEKYENEIESTLPRRAFARREHPRYGHYGASMLVYSSLNNLQRCYRPYIDRGACCFIAGKVIDEAFKAFHSIKATEVMSSYEFRRDLSKNCEMARDHFEEVVEPSLQNMSGNELAHDVSDDSEKSSFEISKNSTSRSDSLSDSIEQKLCKNCESIHYRIAKNRVALLYMKKEVNKMSVKMSEKPSRMRFQIWKLQQQNRKKDMQLKKLRKLVRLARRNNVPIQK